jgi:hypothetical protein
MIETIVAAGKMDLNFFDTRFFVHQPGKNL